MKYLILFLCGFAGSAAASCPDPRVESPHFSATGPDLLAPQSWDVEVRGEAQVPCDEWVVTDVAPDHFDGFLPIAPTAVFDLDGLGPHILMVMAQGQCDARLLVRSSNGLLHFGETANGREEVVVWGASDGPLQVWVGAATQTACDGTVTLETFDR